MRQLIPTKEQVRLRNTLSPRTLAITFLGLILLAACAGPSQSPAPAGGGGRAAPEAGAKKRVTIAIRGNPTTLSDTVNTAGPGGVAGVSELAQMVHVGLVEVVDRRVVGGLRLAEAAPTTENGLWQLFPDGRMETTWRIHPNARWHDGTPFTAEDLVFTARVEQDRELALFNSKAYDSVESIVAPDPHTITVTWRRPYINADIMFSSFGLAQPQHLLGRVYAEDKSSYLDQPYWTREFVGTGPFRLREWVETSHLILEAFDGYVLGRPKLDEVEVRFILDPNAQIANLLAGTVDLTMGRGISLEQAMQARDQWRDGKLDTTFAGTSWIALFPQFVNPSPPVLADVRARRALLHATDRQRLVDVFVAGLTQVAQSYVGPTQPEYPAVESSIVRYEFDPRRAAQLWDELGHTRDAEGSYRDGSGQKLSIEIRTTAGDDLRDKLLFSIVDDWRQAGIGAEALIIPRQRSDDREYRSTRPAFEIVRQPNDLSESALVRLHSSEAALPENGFRGSNRTRYMNPELDALIERYLVTIPFAERLEVVRQMVHHISDQLAVMGVLYDVSPMLISNHLQNVKAELDTRNAHEWDWR
jgi:peptide/nickel transport system substrate-binding protein